MDVDTIETEARKKPTKNDDEISEELVNDLFQQFHGEIQALIG